MSENYTLEQAKVISIGELEQITQKYSKCAVELLVDGTGLTVECPSWHRVKLTAGNVYGIGIERNQYGDKITSVNDPTKAQGSGPQPQPRPQPQREQVNAPSAKAAPQPMAAQQVTGLPTRPDLRNRFDQWGWRLKLAEEEATKRVRIYADLLLANKLLNAAGETIDAAMVGTIRDLFVQESSNLWKEFEVRFPQDWWGHLVADKGDGDA